MVQHFAGSVPQQGHSESSDGGCGGSGRSVCVFLSIDNMFSKVHAVSRPAGYMCIEHTLEIETAGRFYFNCPAGVPYGTTLNVLRMVVGRLMARRSCFIYYSLLRVLPAGFSCFQSGTKKQHSWRAFLLPAKLSECYLGVVFVFVFAAFCLAPCCC